MFGTSSFPATKVVDESTPVHATGSSHDGSGSQIPNGVILVVVYGFSISLKPVVEFRDRGLVFVGNVVAGQNGVVPHLGGDVAQEFLLCYLFQHGQ